MTKEEYEHCYNIDFIFDYCNDRKLRLFACACARQIWHELDNDIQEAVMVAERFVDGLATKHELEKSRERAKKCKLSGVSWVCDRSAERAARYTCVAVTWAANPKVPDWFVSHRDNQCQLLKDEFIGNPFKKYKFNCPTSLAQVIYEERDWEIIPILADQLEENGCDQGILDHLRNGKPHYLGCWVLDLVLGK